MLVGTSISGAAVGAMGEGGGEGSSPSDCGGFSWGRGFGGDDGREAMGD